MAETAPLSPERLALRDIGEALSLGRARYQSVKGSSIAYASVFMLLGLVLLGAIVLLGLSPLVLPFAGGFMLLGPVLLCGYFELALRAERGHTTTFSDAISAFIAAPSGLWLVALICSLLFLIWITDAGTLYSFTLGGTHFGPDLSWVSEFGREVLYFELWGSLMGAVLAYLIFVISAFSVPLLYEKRSGVVGAISASTRAVLGNFAVSLVWGLVLGITVIGSILLLPVLLVALPVMSYASYYLYRRVFPPERAD